MVSSLEKIYNFSP